jgi:enolase-phosphatase E1
MSIQAIVLDIEGTIADIAFVKTVLFPYAEARFAAFLAAHPDLALDYQRQVSALLGETLTPVAVLAQFLAWSQADVKATPLKDLQGRIWQQGFESGALRSALYPDALAKIKQWQAQGLPLYIYSSGSLAAQDLFFRYSIHGDLRGLFQGFFDTTLGDKKTPLSYQKLADVLAIAPENGAFCTDNPEEVAAAQSVGWQVFPIDRTACRPQYYPDFSRLPF